MIRQPLGPGQIGALDPTVALDPSMIDIAWRNEVGIISRQLTPSLVQGIDAYQILSYCLFMTISIAEQIRARGNQAELDLMNYLTNAAYQFVASQGKTLAEYHAQPDAEPFLFIWPEQLKADESQVLQELHKNFLDKSPKPVQ